MSTLEAHKKDSIEKFGKPYEEVHIYIDQYHAKYGAKHRFMLHHDQGIEEIRQKFGNEAALVAESHIKLDCNGRVPKKEDYANRKVDWLGMGEDDYKVIDKRSGLVVLNRNK